MTEIGPVKIVLTAEGLAGIMESFSAIEKRIADLEKKTVASKRRIMTEDEKAARAAQVAAEKATAAAQTQAQKMEAIHRRSSEMAGRYAKQQADEEIRQAERSAATRTRVLKSLTSAGMGAASNFLGGIARFAGGALAIGGGIGVQQAFGHEMAISRAAAAYSVSTNLPGSNGPVVSQKQAIDQARALSAKYNVDETAIIDAQHSITKRTGNVRLAQDMGDFIAKVSKAENIDTQDLGNMIGIIGRQDSKLGSKEIQKFVRIAIGQGKLGGYEATEMINSLPNALEASSLFKGNKGSNMVKMMSLMQFASQGGAANPEQAATAVKNLGHDIIMHEKVFKAHGFGTIVQNGQLIDANYVIAHAIGAAKGDVRVLNKEFGIRASPITNAVSDVYRNAEANQKGSGEKAALDALNAVTQQQEKAAKIEEDLENVRKSTAEQVDKAYKDLIRTLGTEVVPELIKLVPIVQKLLPAIGGLISFIAEHPMEAAFIGLGAAVTKAIVGQIVASGIESGIGNLVTALGPGAGLLGAAVAASAALFWLAKTHQEKLDQDAVDSGANAAAADLKAAGGNAGASYIMNERARRIAEIQKLTNSEGSSALGMADRQNTDRKIKEDQAYLDATANEVPAKIKDLTDALNRNTAAHLAATKNLPPGPTPGASATGTGLANHGN